MYAKINGTSITPKLILIDFEITAHETSSKSFPAAKIKGYQFCFGPSV